MFFFERAKSALRKDLLKAYAFVRGKEGIFPMDHNWLRIICYEDVDSWILGKFAKNLHNELTILGKKSDLAKVGDSRSNIGHHIIYYNARKKWSPIETFMITHLDTDWKIELVRRQLKIYDMGICMSEETRSRLVSLGMIERRLCYINPAHDGIVKPRPLVIGIASKTHADGRKNEDAIVEVFRGLPKEGFTLAIMGMGWDEQVARLRESGCSVTYYNAFDYDTYISSFIPSLDYFIYFSHDEGSMAFLDAIAADVKTIVTPQGYHLDIPGGIDHAIATPADLSPILMQIHNKRMERASRVSSWNWKEYTQRHLLVWEYLQMQSVKTYRKQLLAFTQLINNNGQIALAAELQGVAVPKKEVYIEAEECACRHAMQDVMIQLGRERQIFYPHG